MALKAAISKYGDKITIQTQYNSVLVRLIYELIPVKSRIYRDELNQWFIDEQYEEKIISILEKLKYAVTKIDDPLPAGDDAYSILGLLPSAQWEVCQAAYKALASIHHPDKGGNPDIMKNINIAFDKIKMAKGK